MTRRTGPAGAGTPRGRTIAATPRRPTGRCTGPRRMGCRISHKVQKVERLHRYRAEFVKSAKELQRFRYPKPRIQVSQTTSLGAPNPRAWVSETTRLGIRKAPQAGRYPKPRTPGPAAFLDRYPKPRAWYPFPRREVSKTTNPIAAAPVQGKMFVVTDTPSPPAAERG